MGPHRGNWQQDKIATYSRVEAFMDIREKAYVYENMIGTDHVFVREGLIVTYR